MKQYKLINKNTGEETLCTKVCIDGFDYYVNDKAKIFELDFVYNKVDKEIQKMLQRKYQEYIKNNYICFDKVIATTNLSIDIPKVIDEVEELANKIIPKLLHNQYVKIGFKGGYNKHAQTHSLTEDETVAFGDFCRNLSKHNKDILRQNPDITIEELLVIFKETLVKTLYYE